MPSPECTTSLSHMRARLLLAAAIAITSSVAAAPVADAGAIHSKLRGTDDWTGVVLTCPSENVIFSGVGTFSETDTLTPSGHRAAELLSNLNGVTAVGQTSGTRYRVVGVTSTGFSFSAGAGSPNTADVSRFAQTWLLVPLGGGTPLSFHEVLTVVFDAQGNLVSFVHEGPS